MGENPILIDEKQDKENYPPPVHPTTPLFEKQTQPPVLMRSRPLGTRIENVPDYIFRCLFEWFLLLLLCMYFKQN